MKKRRGRGRIYEALDISPDLTADLPRITLLGAEELLVENHRGLSLCTEKEIGLYTGTGPLCIRGRELELRDFSAERVLIRGSIEGLFYEKRENS